MPSNLETIEKNLLQAGVRTLDLHGKFMFATAIPPDIVGALLTDTIQILEDPTSEPYDYSLAGQITRGRQTKINKRQFTKSIHEFKDMIENLAFVYVERFFAKVFGDEAHFHGKIDMHDIWIVEQKANDYNPLHLHTNESPAGLSGVCYLQTPECIALRNPQERGMGSVKNQAGYLNILSGTKLQPDLNNFVLPSTLSICPAEGNLVMFPQDTPHQVYAFEGEGSRICLAFNINVWYKQEGMTRWSDLLSVVPEYRNKVGHLPDSEKIKVADWDEEK
jgi:hypothetical protein